MNQKILIISILLMLNFELIGQIWSHCPDFNCEKAGFVLGLPNKTLETAAQKFNIKQIIVKSYKGNTVFHYKFNRQGKVVERIYDQMSTTRFSYIFSYDQNGRIQKSIFNSRGCFDALHCTEEYNYKESGNEIRIVNTDIFQVYERDSVIKSDKNLSIGKHPTRKTTYENDVITQVVINDYKTKSQLKELNFTGLDSIISWTDNDMHLNYRDTIGQKLDVFDKWIWRTDKIQIVNKPDTFELVKDNWNKLWRFSYNKVGLRCKEELIATENISAKDAENLKKYMMIVEYIFYD